MHHLLTSVVVVSHVVHPNNTPIKWLAICVSLIAHSIIKEYDGLFMSQGVFIMCFHLALHLIHLGVTIELSTVFLLLLLIAIVFSPRHSLTSISDSSMSLCQQNQSIFQSSFNKNWRLEPTWRWDLFRIAGLN